MKSIRLKLWTSLMLFVGFMLVILWLFQIVFLDKFYLNMHLDQIREKSTEIVMHLESKSISNDEMLQELDTFAYTNNLTLEIMNPEGTVVYQSSNSTEQQIPNLFRKTISQIGDEARKGNTIETTMIHPRFNTNNLVLGYPIHDISESKIIGSLVLIAPMPPVADTADILKSQLIYISMILIIVAFLIALVISNQLSRPIVEIQKAAKKIAKGDWDISISNKSNDEIGQLTVAILEMAEELRKTDNLRKELIGNISHELRTPLSLIKGYAETIRDLTGNIPEKREKQLDIIIRESDRLARLISDILNLSQLETGAIKAVLKPIDLKDVLIDMQNRFENMAIQQNITLDIRPFKSIKVLADVAQIEQVMVNLLSNAFQHCDENKSIRVTTEETLDQVTVAVIDEGSGIPKEHLSSIWDRYYKISKSTESNNSNNKSQGTGLGLAIVKNILENHQSNYGIESEEGQGTKIWFTLKKNLATHR